MMVASAQHVSGGVSAVRGVLHKRARKGANRERDFGLLKKGWALWSRPPPLPRWHNHDGISLSQSDTLISRIDVSTSQDRVDFLPQHRMRVSLSRSRPNSEAFFPVFTAESQAHKRATGVRLGRTNAERPHNQQCRATAKMTTRKKIKYVIFDMDGIIDTRSSNYAG